MLETHCSDTRALKFQRWQLLCHSSIAPGVCQHSDELSIILIDYTSTHLLAMCSSFGSRIGMKGPCLV